MLNKLAHIKIERLVLIARDYTSKQLAQAPYFSIDTVKSHRRNLSRKIRCENLRWFNISRL